MVMVASPFLAPRLAPAAPAPSPQVVPASALIPVGVPTHFLGQGVIPNEIRIVCGKIWVRHWTDNIWIHYGSWDGFASEWVA